MTPHEALNKYYGFTSFREGQEEIINAILAHENVLAILPTGGGKSLCYQIPALLSESFSIVISPLISLMQDQVDALNSETTRAAYINSSLDYRETEKVLNDVLQGSIKLVYVAPEKLENTYFIERLKNLKPEYIFVDEAHCISEWGHNFRHSYTKIKSFCDYLGINKISAFTATATPEVREDIIEQLAFEKPNVFVKGFERDSLSLTVIKTKKKKEKSLELIKKHGTPAIVYCSTRKNCEDAADYLRANGVNAEYYHAGVSSEMRRIIQDDFLTDRINVIVATNAFGMGIDKKDVRLILHYNIPGTIENYYQEVGRAGRDGKESYAYLLFDNRDVSIQDFLIDVSYPKQAQVEQVYNLICDYAKVALGSKIENGIKLDSKFASLLSRYDINKSIFNSSLNILESSGYVKKESSFNNGHSFSFLMKKDELKQYVKKVANAELKELLILLVKTYGGAAFSESVAIDTGELVRKSGIEHNDLKYMLKELVEYGIINYNEPSRHPSIRLLGTRVKQLTFDFTAIQKRKEHAKQKLDSMVSLAFQNECRFKTILDYFGEDTTGYKCGKCDNCGSGGTQSDSSFEYLENIIMQIMHEQTTTIKRTDLIKLLLGKSRHPGMRANKNFGICTHFKKDELDNVIEGLVTRKQLKEVSGRLALSDDGINSFVIDDNPPTNDFPFEYEKPLELFNKLRDVRKRAMERFNQNQNMICPDKVLRTIAKEEPVKATQLLSIEGFTQRMYNKVGEEIIETVIEHKKSEPAEERKELPQNLKTVYELMNKGYKLEDLASLTKIPASLISMQVESIIAYNPETDISKLINKKDVELITSEIEKGTTGLKELKQIAPKIDYAKIRIILAKWKATRTAR